MRRLSMVFVSLVFLSINWSNVFASNDISIRDDLSHLTKPGFIQSATLIIEPHGVNTEQSLYVTYTDNKAFPGKNVEIIHRFELPSGSTVHDLWLWIGDSVMQAKIMKKSTARQIYDSITSFKRDPAFLNVVNGQYEIRIYPLESGQTRKIKITLTNPNTFFGDLANVSLPLNFLKSDNNSRTKLRILFRYDKRLSYEPQIAEESNIKFTDLHDTLDRHYKECIIDDIQKFRFLTLSFKEPCTNGISLKLGKANQGFVASLGVNPAEFFLQQTISDKPRNILLGQDLSGVYGFNIQVYKSELQNFFSSYLRDGDSVRILLAGEGLYDTLPGEGRYVLPLATATSITNAVCSSAVITLKSNRKVPRILFADNHASGFWSFPGLDSLAQCSSATDLMSCLNRIQNFDMVAAYNHGLEMVLSDNDAQKARTEILQFINSGGMFLTYYDYNRGKEKIASYFINGLKLPERKFIASDLIRNPQGPVGSLFPPSFYYYSSCPLIHSDDTVINELTNSNSDPVVISKGFGKGRFIVTGMWPAHNDAALKEQINTALLGLQTLNKNRQLTGLLSSVSNAASAARFDEIVIMSNSDELVTSENITKYMEQVDAGKISNLPPTHCISLLDGQNYSPPVYMDGLNRYFGSGYLLACISKGTAGNYFSTNEYDMGTIGHMIASNIQGIPEKITGELYCAGVKVPDDSVFTIKNTSTRTGMQYFLAKCDNCSTVTVSVSSADSLYKTEAKNYTFSINDVIKENDDAIYTAYSAQIMKKLLMRVPLDTQAIVAFSIKNRLLNDFTAFLAIEPNDSNFYMTDPFDESKYGTPVKKIQNHVQAALSLIIKSGNVLHLSLHGKGRLEIKLFNLNGKCVYSHFLTCSSRLNKALKFNKLGLASGTYIAAAKFVSTDKQNEYKPITRVARIILK